MTDVCVVANFTGAGVDNSKADAYSLANSIAKKDTVTQSLKE
jgi:hypothetical protein